MQTPASCVHPRMLEGLSPWALAAIHDPARSRQLLECCSDKERATVFKIYAFWCEDNNEPRMAKIFHHQAEAFQSKSRFHFVWHLFASLLHSIRYLGTHEGRHVRQLLIDRLLK